MLTPDFKDLVGEGNLVPITVGSFQVDVAVDPGSTTPGDGADEAYEEFTLSGNEIGETGAAALRERFGTGVVL